MAVQEPEQAVQEGVAKGLVTNYAVQEELMKGAELDSMKPVDLEGTMIQR